MNVLLFMPGTLGDTMVCLPALRALSRHYGPQTKFIVLHERWPHIKYGPQDILETAFMPVSFLSYPFMESIWGKLVSYTSLLREIRKRRFNAVVNLTISSRPRLAILRDRLFFGMAQISSLIGFHNLPNSLLVSKNASNRPVAWMHEAIARLKRLEEDGVDTSIDSNLEQVFWDIPTFLADRARIWLVENRVPLNRPLIAIAPGCKQSANQWPLERFEIMGQMILERYPVGLVVVGGSAETEVGRLLVGRWGAAINAAGALSVVETAGLISLCRFVIGLDTGTIHIAGAIGTPCVAIYGCRNLSGRWLPLGKGHRIIKVNVPCEGCGYVDCPLPTHLCMKNIHVDMVLKEVTEMCIDVGIKQR